MTDTPIPSTAPEVPITAGINTSRFPVWRMVCGLVFAVLLIILLASGFGRDPSAIVSPLINHPAPGFTLRTLDGTSLSLARYRGHPVVLNFWASWCTACKIEHPYLVAAWQYYQPKGVAFVGVVYEDSAANAGAFMKQYGGGWPDVLDPGGTTAINYGVYGVPETFFIDRRGIIRYKSTGPVTPSLLVHDINSLLMEDAPK